MIKVDFYKTGEINDTLLEFAVISAEYNGKWVFVRHKERDTWEIPGGHREKDEDINRTGRRELFEETGAKEFILKPVCDYSVTKNNISTYGRLFYAKVNELGKLPELEIEEIQMVDDLPDELTYIDIQPYLFNKTLKWKKEGMKNG